MLTIKINFLLLLFLSPSLICYVTGARQRIIAGEFALPGELPYIATLQRLVEGCTYAVCGGSILDEYHIVTAAHCVTDNETGELKNEQITIGAGATNLTDKKIGVYRDVGEVFIPLSYTSYKKNQTTSYDDIAILKLRHPLPLADYETLGTVQLPNADEYLPPDTYNGTTSGFGISSEILHLDTGKVEGSSDHQLKYASGVINAIDNFNGCKTTEVCFTTFEFSNGNLEGPCGGDSGGPLVIENTNILVGITSYTYNEYCGQNEIFIRITSYLDFIKKVRDNAIDETISSVKLTLDYQDAYPYIPFCI